MRNISIFLLNIFQFGGIERVVSILANNLIVTGKYKIEIISLFKTDQKPAFPMNELIKISHVFDTSFDIKKNFIKVVRGCRSFARDKKINVLITAGMGYVPITWLSFKPKKHIAWEHSNITIGKRFGITWLGRQISCRFFDNVVVLTKRDLNNYQQIISKSYNINQIYNPLEFELCKSEYNADTNKIISCGRLSKQKGFDLLIDVAKIVMSRHPDWQWDIYGDGEERIALEKKIATNELTNHVFLKGFRNHMSTIYGDYSIYVMTSRYEGFGMVLIEAHSQKLPIVSFDCNCGPSELITDGENGYLVECFNVHLMANKVCELIEDRNKRLLFSTHSKLDKEKLKLEIFIKSWTKLIDV